MSADKNQILEPITAVARLTTLIFKPKGTKIAIRDHNVVLCEPQSDTYYGIKIPQGIDRYWNGDSREDVYVLNHVFCNFILWYIIPSKTEDPELYKQLINLSRYLRVSLRELQKTYKTGTTVGTLQYYIIVLSAIIDDTFYEDMLYNHQSSQRISFLDANPGNPDDLVYSTIFDVSKIKTFWTRDELFSLCELFSQCFREANETETIVFKSNDRLDNPKHIPPVYGTNRRDKRESCVTQSLSEEDIADLLHDAKHSDLYNSSDDNETILDIDTPQFTHTSRQKTHSNRSTDLHEKRRTYSSTSSCNANPRSWPIPNSITNVLVQGGLVGISNVLDLMDKKFKNILSQSVRGN